MSELITQALRAAARAPSPQDRRPWLFRAHGERVEVHLDHSLAAHPDARATLLACGAAVHNLRVAVAARGRRVVVDWLPGPEHLASVLLTGQSRPTRYERALAACIETRRRRAPFPDGPVPDPARRALHRAALAGGARLLFLDGDTELPAVLRETEARRHEHDPLFAVLHTENDTEFAQLRAGAAMQHVLLTATHLGLATGFRTLPTGIASARPVLRELCGGRTHPQTMLLLGEDSAAVSDTHLEVGIA
ncbi:nitroreductase family protein [Sciscionella marina]|uniref:nitroreductase family protein n=1 Tax=Sciscionella marina TaxID=508770 RepID=UPI00036546DD|nr:nitroreductase family protein [Sciscionella marina]